MLSTITVANNSDHSIDMPLKLETGAFLHVQHSYQSHTLLEGYVLQIEEYPGYQPTATVEVYTGSWIMPTGQLIPRLQDFGQQSRNPNILMHPCGHYRLGVQCFTSLPDRNMQRVLEISPPDCDTTHICTCGVLQAPGRYRVEKSYIEQFMLTRLYDEEGSLVHPCLTVVSWDQTFNREYWGKRLKSGELASPASGTLTLVDSGVSLFPQMERKELEFGLEADVTITIEDYDKGNGSARTIHPSRQSSLDEVVYPRRRLENNTEFLQGPQIRKWAKEIKATQEPNEECRPLPWRASRKWSETPSCSTRADKAENWRRASPSPAQYVRNVFSQSRRDYRMQFKGTQSSERL